MNSVSASLPSGNSTFILPPLSTLNRESSLSLPAQKIEYDVIEFRWLLHIHYMTGPGNHLFLDASNPSLQQPGLILHIRRMPIPYDEERRDVNLRQSLHR